MIGEYLRFGVGGGDIEPEFFDESPFDLRGECLEGFEYMGVIPVYIEVVGVDGSDYRNLRKSWRKDRSNSSASATTTGVWLTSIFVP